MENDNEWVLEVLSDLKVYAEENDLPMLAEFFCVAESVALKEISLKAGTSKNSVAQGRSSLP
ncbi:hypothetical protein [Roseobacter litoralis]|uniref:Uncharacterized protein n=1 Tax=Roseobacter litoralis (strain ATCC 49566 / DSM 6996 / JCM 21268 / NBRC 15278 / OCh 149) TaxID=391595 RepID=F7ZBI0_ROSLO|nr:hypothetical protein [Roseobacter litoralis]AEI95562.1 hypothetical protein RLO149_c036270 [Roseobacter litoralis Och 149]